MDALARLVAIEEIRQLKMRYFRFMDTEDFDSMAQVFCTDAMFDCSEGPRVRLSDGSWQGDAGPVIRGREAIIEWVRGSLAGRNCTHHGHGHEVTIDSPTQAHGIIAMEDRIRLADRRTRLVEATGHYHERYRVEDGEWRIAETKLTRLFRDTF